MSLAAIAIVSFAVALSGALSPGPLLAITMGRAVRYGAREGPLLITGHSILELAMVVLLVFGFGYYLRNPVITSIIGLVGGCVLILFGVWMLFGTTFTFVDEFVENNKRQKSSSVLKSILSGIVVSFLNPYWFLWWITIGLTYLTLALPKGVSGILAFFIGHISADFLWYSIVSLFLAKGIKPYRFTAMLVIIKLCGIFLIGFGIFLIANVLT